MLTERSWDFRYDTAGEMYTAMLARLFLRGQWVDPITTPSSPSVGQDTLELLAPRLILTNPRARLIVSEARPLNIAACLGLFFYFVTEGRDLAQALYYNPLAMKFSDDAETIRGSCYGFRVSHQLQRALRLVRESPPTRRAVVTIYDGDLDLMDSVDVPCPVLMQFFVRADELVLETYFRSQNMLMVFPYDLFLFTMLQEWWACHLGLQLGVYIQVGGSAHVYASECMLAQEVVKGMTTSYNFPVMTKPSEAEWQIVLDYEMALRLWGHPNTRVDAMPDLSMLESLSPYWRAIVTVLHTFAVRRRAGELYLRDWTVLGEAFHEVGL